MNVKSGFYFSTLGEVLKLRSIFHRPNKAVNENAAYGLVYSTYMKPNMHAGEPRRHFWFLKFGASCEEALATEKYDTPCILWVAKRPSYSKIQVEVMRQSGDREIITYPVWIQCDEKRLTVGVGGKKIMRVGRREFQFTDITLRNISRAAGREFIYRNGRPVIEVNDLKPLLYEEAKQKVLDFLSPI